MKDKDKERKREYDEQKITGFFDKDTRFKGELSFKGSFRIDGHFQGKIVSDSMLVIGEQGKVEADVQVGYIVINGEVKGTIRADDKVEIHSRGRVLGSIITPKLVVDEGAYLEANCQAGEQIAAASPQEDKPKEGASS
ncbi:MAG TPA: polymer-forming cytoskeletal protein [Candidatus Desulfaltia sp.]|nr:polymer-forming cytoskeletal protein [Candidatus Desulfaltia sp.]